MIPNDFHGNNLVTASLRRGTRVVAFFFGFALLTTLLALSASPASAATVYVSQNGGAFSGGSACNGQNTVSIGTSNSASYNPGDVVYLCGVLTSSFSLNGSGASGKPITVNFDTGAKVSLPNCGSQCFNIAGSYVTVNGGTPCGPGTACATNEENNPTNSSPQTGTIEATSNGSGLATQTDPSNGIVSGGAHVTVKNIIIRNIYQHTSFNDIVGSSNETGCWGIYNNTGQTNTTDINLFDSTLHDCAAGFTGRNGTDFATVQRNDIFRVNWGVSQGVYSATYVGSGTCGPADLCSQGWVISDNHFGSVANWDNANNSYHHNRIMLYTANDHAFAGGRSGGQLKNYFIYNNLMDGAAGCCSTSHTFIDDPPVVNFYYFNNVHNNGGQSTGIANNMMELTSDPGSTNVFVYNNTVIGAGGNLEVQSCTSMNTAPTGSTWRNNVITSCYDLIYAQAGAGNTFSNNQYANGGGIGHNNGGGIWAAASACFTLACWQALPQSGGDPNSAYYNDQSSLLISATGVPLTGSPLITAGANLTSLCSGNLAALCSDTSAGGTRTPTARPASGPWTIGAFNVGGGTPAPPPPPPQPNKPAPPTNLAATVN